MNLQSVWCRTGLRRCLLVGLSFVLAGIPTTGCDAVDPEALFEEVSQVGESAERAAASLASSSTRHSSESARSQSDRSPSDPDMKSIGPEESQRIYYQFVDDRGRVQFVERLSDVPVAWRDRVGHVEMNQPPPLTPVEARKSWKLSSSEASKILLASNRPLSPKAGDRQRDSVILYSADWCGYCTKAKKHLDREGIEYEVRDVDNGAIARELREKTGRGGVPVLDFSGEILRGYSPDRYQEAVESIRG